MSGDTAAVRAFAVHFSELSRWDPGSFHEIEWGWPETVMVPISNVLSPRKEKAVRTENDFSTLQPVTIHLDGTMSKREVAAGREYSMELWTAKAGDFIAAKIDLKSGAVGIVPEGWGSVVVTGHFAVYVPDHARLEPKFLHLLIQSSFLKEHLWRNKVGAEGRMEVKLEFFESLRIPLPPLATQRAIVARWREAQARVAAAHARADAHDAEARAEFNAALALRDTGRPITAKAFALRWQDVSRWSLGYIRKASVGLIPHCEHFPVVRLGDVIADLVNGWSPKCIERPVQGDEWGVLKLGAVSFGEYDPAENKALPKNLEPIPELEIKAGDVLISRANVERLVGACAIVHVTPPRLLLCDKIFRVEFQPDSSLDGAFLAEVLKAPHLRRQIECAITGSSATMQNITKESLLDLRIPLPPLAEQRALVARVAAARAEIARERAEAARLATAIAAETEALLLGTQTLAE